MQNVPLGVKINSARFGITMGKAVEYLEIGFGINVLNTWYKRIDYQIKNGKILDDHEMSIAANLMELTKHNYDIRKELFLNLINYNDSCFVLSNLKWILNYWCNLDESEISQIINIVNSNRKDTRWIKAVLLNAPEPPKEIILNILGDESLFEKEIEHILAVFPDQLIADCLNVFCGFPQPLDWIAVNYKNKVFWNNIIRYILLNKNHHCFSICLQEFLNHGVNGFNDDWQDWEMLWNNICINTKCKKTLVDALIYNTANCNCVIASTKKLWDILIANYATNEQDIVDLVSINIELLQQTGDAEDLLEIFEPCFLDKVIKNLPFDYALILTLQNVLPNTFLTEDNQLKVMDVIIENTRDSHIRFFKTHNFINILEYENSIPANIIKRLKELPNVIDEIGQAKLSVVKMKYEYKLDDWIVIN